MEQSKISEALQLQLEEAVVAAFMAASTIVFA